APGDALDDEGGVLVDQHQAAAPIFSTARFAASCIETERSKYSTPYFSRILKPSSSQAPGIRKTAIFSAASSPSSREALITPRAPSSTGVLETMLIITAILSPPGFSSARSVSFAAFETLGLSPIRR